MADATPPPRSSSSRYTYMYTHITHTYIHNIAHVCMVDARLPNLLSSCRPTCMHAYMHAYYFLTNIHTYIRTHTWLQTCQKTETEDVCHGGGKAPQLVVVLPKKGKFAAYFGSMQDMAALEEFITRWRSRDTYSVCVYMCVRVWVCVSVSVGVCGDLFFGSRHDMAAQVFITRYEGCTHCGYIFNQTGRISLNKPGGCI
jgi:hypothetical protein